MKKAIAFLAAAGASIAGLGYYFSERILHHTMTEDLDGDIRKEKYKQLVEKIDGEKITIRSDYGYKMVGHTFIQDKTINKFMIVVHGVTCSKEYGNDYIDLFLNMGFNVIAMDSRYHGESGGKDISYGYYEGDDLKKVVDYTKKRFGNDILLGIHGVSMGAGVTLIYAGNVEDGADFYIVDCPYSNFYDEALYRIQYDFKYAPKFTRKFIVDIGDFIIKCRSGFSLKEVSPIDHVNKIKSPVMFINTKEDKYIPHQMSQDLYDRKKDNKYIYWVESGGHSKAYEEDPTKYREEIEGFLEKYIG